MRSPGSSDGARRVRVLIVDDSAAARTLISGILGSDDELEIVGSAGDGHEAIAMAQRLHPAVITMDLVMPRLDGLEAIRRIMGANPTPIVVVATPQASSRWVFQAMEAGAVTVLEKPCGPGDDGFELQARRLISAVKLTAGASVAARRAATKSAGRRDRDGSPGPAAARVEIVAIAASTGGPQALGTIVRQLPAELGVPIVVVQHIAAGFEAGLAQWLGEIGALRARVAGAGEPLRAGELAVAPGGKHLGVNARGVTTLSADAPIGGFRPSATYLFRAVAAAYGRRALGVVLSGIGDDGAEGLLAVKRAGGSVIAQDEASCVVYGMPRAAVTIGAVDRVLSPAEIGAAIIRACDRA